MKYSRIFYKNQQRGSMVSAQTVVPYVIELFRPASVVDVGCGIGTWLSVFSQNGVESILGIDGSYVDRSQLKIPKKYFKAWDISTPLKLKRRFDLAVSLEVAEHIDKEQAEIFINSLTELSDIILFSAAIPLQGGTHHVNEQWPDYWKTLFNNKNYVLIDCLRSKFWEDENVEPWYSQNMFLYIKKSKLKKIITLDNIISSSNVLPLVIVHPENYLNRTIRKKDIVKSIVRKLASKII